MWLSLAQRRDRREWHPWVSHADTEGEQAEMFAGVLPAARGPTLTLSLCGWLFLSGHFTSPGKVERGEKFCFVVPDASVG